jgi:hypothetical protein
MHNAKYTKEMNYNEEIFQLEIKSERKFSSGKKFKYSSYCYFILYTIFFGTQNKEKLPITLLCYKYFFNIGV